ncbi:MAG: S1 RNA-binding domain-containing protein [Firmicutes bacterium]|nr:S1 RNA-binding domain-containing protein [Bacillota bacterium]
MEIKIPQVGDIIKGTVVSVNQEEVLVDVGYMFEGTIYKDHLSATKVTDAREFVKVGDELEAKVTKISHGDENNIMLLSRLQIEKNQIREGHINELQIGKDITAKVKRSNPGGLELDYHGIELFMPGSMIDVANADDDLKNSLIGKNVDVRIVDVKENRAKKVFIANRKLLIAEQLRLQEKNEMAKLEIHSIVKGKVTKVLPFGAVVSLSDHLEGLLHISECSHFHIKSVEEVVKVDDEIDVQIIKIAGRKINLSLRSMQKKPWDLFIESAKVGDKVTGTIVKKMQFGMLVEIQRDVIGLLNRYDYSWDPQDNLAGRVEVGNQLELEIISINPEKKQVGLSKKHLSYNPWADVKFKLGDIVSATVKTIMEKGAVLEIEGVDGFIPISEISEDRINRVEDVLKVGDILSVEVTTFFPKEWKLVVSKRKITEKASRKEYEEQLKENVSANQSLADLFSKFKK